MSSFYGQLREWRRLLPLLLLRRSGLLSNTTCRHLRTGMPSYCRSFTLRFNSTTRENGFFIIKFKLIKRVVWRLTRINLFNGLRLLHIPQCQHLHREVTMNTTFYLKKRYMFVTKVRRRVWLRRKAKFEYTNYFNLISYWTADYRFFKKQISFTFNYQLSKVTSVIQNLSFFRNEYHATGFHSEFVYSAPITRQNLVYINKLGYSRSTFWLKDHSILQTFASYFDYKEVERIPKQVYSENFMIKSHSFAQNVLYDEGDLDNFYFTSVVGSLFGSFFVLHTQTLV